MSGQIREPSGERDLSSVTPGSSRPPRQIRPSGVFVPGPSPGQAMLFQTFYVNDLQNCG